MKRIIRKGRLVASLDVQNALESLFVAETLKGSTEFWIVSPWLSDVAIIDNRGGRFAHLSELGDRKLKLTEVLLYLVERFGTKVTVVISDDGWASEARQGIPAAFKQAGKSGFLNMYVKPRNHLHDKIIATKDWLVSGSMNFTNQGITVRDEHVDIETDPAMIAPILIDLRNRYPVGGADNE
jgi:hypothetical protein